MYAIKQLFGSYNNLIMRLRANQQLTNNPFLFQIRLLLGTNPLVPVSTITGTEATYTDKCEQAASVVGTDKVACIALQARGQ